jgi:hypothetical protein
VAVSLVVVRIRLPCIVMVSRMSVRTVAVSPSSTMEVPSFSRSFPDTRKKKGVACSRFGAHSKHACSTGTQESEHACFARGDRVTPWIRLLGGSVTPEDPPWTPPCRFESWRILSPTMMSTVFHCSRYMGSCSPLLLDPLNQ